jgi:hypothetical protein
MLGPLASVYIATWPDAMEKSKSVMDPCTLRRHNDGRGFQRTMHFTLLRARCLLAWTAELPAAQIVWTETSLSYSYLARPEAGPKASAALH